MHNDQLIETLHGLDPVHRAVLELRYAHRVPLAQIAGMLNRPPQTVQELLEEAVEMLNSRIGVESLEQGVAAIVALAELPQAAWDNPAPREMAAQV